jgi:hypothetical protein
MADPDQRRSLAAPDLRAEGSPHHAKATVFAGQAEQQLTCRDGSRPPGTRYGNGYVTGMCRAHDLDSSGFQTGDYPLTFSTAPDKSQKKAARRCWRLFMITVIGYLP